MLTKLPLNIFIIIMLSGNFLFAKGKIARKVSRDPSSAISTNAACKTESDRLISSLTSSKKLIKVQADATDKEVFRLKTESPSKWLEIHYEKSLAPKVYEISNEKIIEHNFDSHCKAKQKISSGFDFSKSYPDKQMKFVNDAELQNLMGHNRKGIIYVWSPSMVYSVKFLKRYRDAAKELKVDFISLLDPRASDTDQHMIATELGTPETNLKLNSVNLFMLGGTEHFPTMFVFKNGVVSEEMLVGVYDHDSIVSKINQLTGSGL
ncbi:MAG: hypothetical protein H7061_04950 [Bdellovibrionaceae bacterium]|nr:hypothetical protein [Bdellovibrio sp.]